MKKFLYLLSITQIAIFSHIATTHGSDVADSSNMIFSRTIRFQGGEVACIRISLSATFGDLKENIWEQTGIPRWQLRIPFDEDEKEKEKWAQLSIEELRDRLRKSDKLEEERLAKASPEELRYFLSKECEDTSQLLTLTSLQLKNFRVQKRTQITDRDMNQAYLDYRNAISYGLKVKLGVAFSVIWHERATKDQQTTAKEWYELDSFKKDDMQEARTLFKELLRADDSKFSEVVVAFVAENKNSTPEQKEKAREWAKLLDLWKKI